MLACELLCWSSCEAALVSFCASRGLDVEALNVRGRLVGGACGGPAPAVGRFRAAMFTAAPHASVSALAACRASVVRAAGSRRTLVATAARRGAVYDVALSRDRSAAIEGLIVYVSRGGDRVGAVLVAVEAGEAAGPPTLVLRGASVAETARGRGHAVLVVAIFLALADELGAAAATRAIDKPLLALALSAAGLSPVKTSWGVYVARDPRNGARGAALVWAADTGRDARCIFSNALCKSQRLRVKAPDEPPPEDARLAHVKTAYFRCRSPAPAATTAPPDLTWYPARLLAFANGIPDLRRHLLRADDGPWPWC